MMIRQRRFRLGQRVKLHDLSTEGAGNAYPNYMFTELDACVTHYA